MFPSESHSFDSVSVSNSFQFPGPIAAIPMLDLKENDANVLFDLSLQFICSSHTLSVIYGADLAPGGNHP